MCGIDSFELHKRLICRNLSEIKYSLYPFGFKKPFEGFLTYFLSQLCTYVSHLRHLFYQKDAEYIFEATRLI